MKAVFLGKREEVPSVKTFAFQPRGKYEFKAGQFAFFNFELKGKGYSKHFTISNSPTRKNIRLTTIVSESDYKQALDSMPRGQEIELSSPMGEFTLKKSMGKQAVFLAGGIGITPMRSMLEYLADKNMDRECVLFYSNRNEERIAFRGELEKLAETVPGLKVVHTLTQPSEWEKTKWRGETGYIDRAMIERNCPYWNKAIFFVAGPPAFVEAMKKMLSAKMKVPAERIVAENFSGY